MTNTTQLFEQAQLTEACYANLSGTENNSDLLKTRLINQDGNDYDFSETQAAEFIKNWRVVHHQPDTASPGRAHSLAVRRMRA